MAFDSNRGFGLLGPGPMRTLASDDPITRLKKLIGFSDEPVQDAEGYWTIGYGRRLNDTPGGPRPYATVSEPIAEEELRYRLSQDDESQMAEASTLPANSGTRPDAATERPSINDPDAAPPTYESLGFDPNGPSEWDVRLRHLIAAIPAVVTGGIAQFLIKPDNYTGNFHNDAADAYRHARWSQLLTRFAGPDAAKEFTDAYERTHPNPDGERLMDLYNNQVGRSTPGFGSEPVEDALKKGRLRTRPFKK